MLVAKNFSDIVTFARASSGTFVGSDGLVKVAGNNQARLDFNPVTLVARGLLVEEQRTNLMPYSQHLNNTTVQRNYGTVTPNAGVSPSGANDAFLFTGTGGYTGWDSYPTDYGLSGGVTQTISIFAKAGTTASVRLTMGGQYADFNLSSGTKTAEVGLTGTIASCGNGWFRLSATLVKSNIYWYWSIALDGGANTSNSAFLWGAQLEVGAFATSYIPSSVTFTGRTSTATFIGSNGLIQTAASGVARQQYNPLNLSADPFVLLEEQRTNRFIQSAAVNGSWSTYGTPSNMQAAAAISPDGTLSAIQVTSDTGGGVPTPGAGTFTFSFFVKQGTSATVRMWWAGLGLDPHWTFTFSTKVLTVNNRWTNPQVQEYGNGWFRISATTNHADLQNYYWGLYAAAAGQTFFIWGAQIEAGSYATSYIPTTTAQVTRAADTSTSAQTTRSADEASVNTLSPWFSASAGTIYVEASIPASASTRGPVRFDDGTANNRLMIRDGGATRIDGRVISGGTSVANLESAATAFTANTTFKAALAYAVNDFALSFNGGAALTDTAGALPSAISRLLIGDANASNTDKGALIRRITYYPRRMSNAELQTLTA